VRGKPGASVQAWFPFACLLVSLQLQASNMLSAAHVLHTAQPSQQGQHTHLKCSVHADPLAARLGGLLLVQRWAVEGLQSLVLWLP